MQPTSSFTLSPVLLYSSPLVISGEWQKYAAHIVKPTQTGIKRNKYTFCIMKSLEPPKNLWTIRVFYLGLVLYIFVKIVEIYLIRQPP